MKKIIKNIYSAIPFKKNFFKLIKRIGIPSEKLYRHLHFKGKYTIQIESNIQFEVFHHGYLIENEIFWAGFGKSWEKESLLLWSQLCKDSSVIFDIGANTGIYALSAQAINPKAKVYAFEPVSRVYNKLTYNIKINDFPIKSYEKALSNMTGEAIIYDTNSEHTYSVTVNKNSNTSNSKVFKTKIKTITIDDFIKEEGLSRIDLMKIDVEAHEAEVLEGFKENLKKLKPTILVEILNENVAAKIAEIVKECDYIYFNIDENIGIRKVEKITKSDYYNFLLCSNAVANKLGLV